MRRPLTVYAWASHLVAWSATLVALWSCDVTPTESPRLLPGNSLSCRHTEKNSVTIAVCDFKNSPDKEDEFLALRRLPPREATLRSRMWVTYDGQTTPRKDGTSFMVPLDEPSRDVAGWAVYDAGLKAAMVVMTTTAAAGIVASKLNTTNTIDVLALTKDIQGEDTADTAFAKLSH